jgi:hypothetical protein
MVLEDPWEFPRKPNVNGIEDAWEALFELIPDTAPDTESKLVRDKSYAQERNRHCPKYGPHYA